MSEQLEQGEVKAIVPVPVTGSPPRQEERQTAFLPVLEIETDPHQPRSGGVDYAKVMELAESIRQNGGLTHPITVTRPPAYVKTPKTWTILCGEMRWMAHVHLGWSRIECLVDERELDPAERLHIQLQENVARQDLTLLQRVTAEHRRFELSGLDRKAYGEKFGVSLTALSRLKKAHKILFPTKGDRAETQELKEMLRSAASTGRIDALEVVTGVMDLDREVARQLLQSTRRISKRQILALKRAAQRGPAVSHPRNIVSLSLAHEQLLELCNLLELGEPESPDDAVARLMRLLESKT